MQDQLPGQLIARADEAIDQLTRMPAHDYTIVGIINLQVSPQLDPKKNLMRKIFRKSDRKVNVVGCNAFCTRLEESYACFYTVQSFPAALAAEG